MCTRAVQKTIEYSSKEALETMIRRCGLSTLYNIFEYSIRGHNGTKFMFQGLERNRESIRGWESIDIIWVDEAQAVERETWDILLPTARKHGVEIWVTFNPRRSVDEAWQMATKPGKNWFVKFVTFNDAPSSWRSPQAEEIRLRMKNSDPIRYAHEYLGELDERGDSTRVMPWRNLGVAVDKYDRSYAVGVPLAGLDVADSDDGDWNCLVIRKGPVVTYIERWRGLGAAETAEKAHNICKRYGVTLLSYDAGGIGNIVKSALNHLNPSYEVRPIHFGGKVTGADVYFQWMISNKDYFGKRKDQLGWNLRMRLERLARMIKDGEEKVSFTKEDCLYISPDSLKGDLHMDDVLKEMAQPIWEQDISGRIVIDKDPEEMGSPDIYDAICLAYQIDSITGLQEDV